MTQQQGLCQLTKQQIDVLIEEHIFGRKWKGSEARGTWELERSDTNTAEIGSMVYYRPPPWSHSLCPLKEVLMEELAKKGWNISIHCKGYWLISLLNVKSQEEQFCIVPSRDVLPRHLCEMI